MVGLALATCFAFAPAVAHAGQGNSTTPTFPTSVTVGQTGLDGSISIFNDSTANQANGVSTICNFGDVGKCADDDPVGITLVPSCGAINLAIRQCTDADPGVFSISPTAVGANGTGCQGVVFDVALDNPTLGRYRFTPQGGAHVSLASQGRCIINFKLNVVALPTKDAEPGIAGVQTSQLASSRLVSTVDPTGGQGTGTQFGTTVVPPPTTPPPPPEVCIPPPGPTPLPPGRELCSPLPCIPPPGPTPMPAGRELCSVPNEPASVIRPTARITGRSGCVTQNFNVTVTGRRISRVAFYLDGRLIRSLTRPNSGTRFVLPVRPGTLPRGAHTVVARTTFAADSGTRPRSLRVRFLRCGRAAQQPRFTG